MVSVVIGLGLAAVFRATCSGQRCIVVKGPPLKEVQDKTFRIDGSCYKYTPFVVPCNDSAGTAAPVAAATTATATTAMSSTTV
jgi:hypothetical protein